MKRDYTGNSELENCLSSPAKKMMNSNSESGGQFYKTNEEIEVLHPSQNTADSDLILRILAENGVESRCLVPLDKRQMCNEIPYLDTLCQNGSNAYQTPQEIEFTIPGLDQLSHVREFFTAVYSTNTIITVDNCFDMYRISKAFDCIEKYGTEAESHIRSHLSLETILETNSLGKEFSEDCKSFLETVKRQLATQNGKQENGVKQESQEPYFGQATQQTNQQPPPQKMQQNQQQGFSGGVPSRKMKICQYFMQGTCQRSAEQCSYAHGPQDLAAGSGGGQQNGGGFQNNGHNGRMGGGGFNNAGGAGGAGRKTRLCNQFMQQNRCSKGPQCTYAHGTHELASFGNPSENPGVKFHKTKMCKHFVEQGSCQHGTNCSYAHGEHELNTPAPQASGNFNQQQQQQHNFNPQTNFAYNQTFSQNNVGGGHQKPFGGGGKQLLKLKLCFQFQQKNYCSKNDNCTFAHGEHELNTPQGSGVATVGAGGHGRGPMNQGQMNQGNMNQGGMNQGGMGQAGMTQGGMNQGGMNQVSMAQASMGQGNNNPKAMGSQNFGEMTYFG
jgi:hypothetical protein